MQLSIAVLFAVLICDGVCFGEQPIFQSTTESVCRELNKHADDYAIGLKRAFDITTGNNNAVVSIAQTECRAKTLLVQFWVAVTSKEFEEGYAELHSWLAFKYDSKGKVNVVAVPNRPEGDE